MDSFAKKKKIKNDFYKYFLYTTKRNYHRIATMRLSLVQIDEGGRANSLSLRQGNSRADN